MATSSQSIAGENISQAATKIARQNISNIVAKLRSGKTLSISEQKAMERWEAETNDGEWVKDTSALAKELGLNRGAIYDARAKYGEEAPKKEQGSRRENLRAWQKFCAEKLIGKDGASHTLADLKAELMREQIRLARSKNEREAGDVIDREVVEAMLVTLGQKLNLLLRLKLEVELGPRGVGMNAAELNVEGGVILGEIREVINANIATFEGEALDRSRDGEGQA
jgi:hypothetical protein